MIGTDIKEVSIYRNGCIVRRGATVHLEAGIQSIEIAGLNAPNGMQVSSDSVRLFVPEGISGTNVQVENPDADDIRKATAELQDGIRKKENEIEVLSIQKELWTDNSNFTANNSATVEGISAYIEKLPERLESIYAKTEKLTKELTQLKEDLGKRTTELRQQLVRADLTAAQPGDYPIEITYFVQGASWTPFYEIHTEEDSEDITVKLRCRIVQITNEDWKGVKLSLYSTDPSLSGTIPTLRPSYLNFEVQRPTTQRFAAAKMSRNVSYEAARAVMDEEVCDEEAPMEMMGAGMMMNQVSFGGAQVNNDDTAVEYVLGGTWDLAKGKEIICDLTSQTVKSRYHVITVPKIDTCAYLAAEVATSDIEQLYDTEASIYIKGAFMGNAWISPDPSKDTYDISLGKDETVKVERKQTRKYTQNVLLKGQKKTELEYEITVTSRKPRTTQLTVLDQIPVSNDKAIIVENDELSSGEFDEKTGQVKWEISLESGEKAVKKLAYSVSYPKDKRVIL
ncbi:MAG: mucoidy inhibitor MuiA family protein [Eubacteriaceae bacterium]|nr:mucoidy inhibitor MuiA family protein [Eubacteriaceae bacterium]